MDALNTHLSSFVKNTADFLESLSTTGYVYNPRDKEPGRLYLLVPATTIIRVVTSPCKVLEAGDLFIPEPWKMSEISQLNGLIKIVFTY
ncbi:hypothetical protein [Adhaeribacter aquaticus]|uniref:hypothetical protein n=1 Tax=Adhaeribacter aquaticus TaxID=299567 RepID=UPI0004032935|nr:hypothetical protein [Adhaeribacter aquaticus]